MSASFSRANRRRIEDLQQQVDIILDGDRRFFERHTSRNHRLRLAGLSEVRILEEIHGSEALHLPPGQRWYVVVRQIEPGARVRNYVPNDADIETDISEDAAEWIFERMARDGSQVKQVETAVRGVLAKRGAQ